jgi:hypothetical protein
VPLSGDACGRVNGRPDRDRLETTAVELLAKPERPLSERPACPERVGIAPPRGQLGGRLLAERHRQPGPVRHHKGVLASGDVRLALEHQRFRRDLALVVVHALGDRLVRARVEADPLADARRRCEPTRQPRRDPND